MALTNATSAPVEILVKLMYKFDDRKILSTLSRMPGVVSVAFAAACASRLAPGYEIAQEYLGEGESRIVSRAIDALWDFASGGDGADWESMAAQLLESIPDEEVGASFAHAVVDDALAATAYAARVALRADPQDAVWSAQRAYDTVDRFVSLKLNAIEMTDRTESVLLEQRVVQEELERQARDLAVLELASPESLSDAIGVLRSRSRGERSLPLEDLKHCLSG